MFEQKLDNLDAVLLASDVQGGEAVERPSVRIGLTVQQELGDTHVTAVRCDVQRRQVVDGNLVDGCPVVEQYSCRVHVVTL